MLIEEPEVKRFRISQDDLNPVMDDQLVAVDLTDKVFWSDHEYFVIKDLTNEDGEYWEYYVWLDRFRIE
jgi:hypothetical protein